MSKNRKLIESDLVEANKKTDLSLSSFFSLLYWLHNDIYFRSIFYHRLGPYLSMFISWIRPSSKYFLISATTTIGRSFNFSHPYSTILNANRIGDNVSIKHLTTIGNIGNDNTKRPVIMDNVIVGANATIIGEITIGNNVIIGAGCVITKSIPPNTTVVGNPAFIIRQNGERINKQL